VLVNPRLDLNWLITEFAGRVPSIAHAALVSSSGLRLACSDGLPAERVDQLAAVASGLTSLVYGAARLFQGGPAAQTVVIMEQGMLILKPISYGTVLAVLAAPECDLGLVSYEIVLLGEQAGRILTPAGLRQLTRRVVPPAATDRMAPR
jgi:predicted regulator of Ras-like GTPase activity (Roadblock/LC7/MglB family)